QHIGNERRLGPTQRRYAVLPVEEPRYQLGPQPAAPSANQRDPSGLWHLRRTLTPTLRSDVCRGAPDRCRTSRFLEARTVVILLDHVDHGRNLIALESRVAELTHAPFERVRLLRNERSDLGCDHFAGDRIRYAAHGDVLDVVDLQ